MGFLDRKKQRLKAEAKDAKVAARAAAEASRAPTATTEQVSEAFAAFRDRGKREQRRYEDATDSEFWFAVCFHTREDKEAFLREHGVADLGDKYIDGYKLSEALLRPKE